VRLLIDAQCIQSTSSLRGIGRYALSLTRALVQEAGPHQVEVLLNGGDDPTRLMRARAAIEGFLPARSIHVFDAPWPWTPPYDHRRRPAAEAAHAAAVRSLAPDALLVASPFEGDTENVTAIRPTPADPPCAAILYDLIPALDPGTYLLGPGASIYWRRFEAFQRCDALLAISEHSGSQAVQLLGQRCPPVTPVWGGPYPSGDFPDFEPQSDDVPGLVLPPRFVLSVGGDHPRKNLDRLVAAWGRVPRDVRLRNPLVLACRLNPGTVRRLRRIARRSGVSPGELVLTGGVSEQTLHDLYRRALAFVFPSIEEGLGMPPLEAMAVGCPTVLARGSSLSELADDDICFFDGLDVDNMAGAIARAVTDEAVRDRLQQAATRSSEQFTWRRSAQLAWAALQELPARPPAGGRTPAVVPLSDPQAVAQLTSAPAPVALDAPLPTGPVGDLGLALAPRVTLAAATALLAPDRARAQAAVGAGLVDHPVLVEHSDLAQFVRHDFYGVYAEALAGLGPLEPDLAARVVDAVARPPRWTLQRPRPVWLLLTEEAAGAELRELAATWGVDLVLGRLAAVALAPSVDVVLLDAADVGTLEPALAHARRRGARVTALHARHAALATPAWVEDLVLGGDTLDPSAWQSAVRPRASGWGRSTGWPWRAGG
jgi:glycosyltransferase involved in cell wall biosynthesis